MKPKSKTELSHFFKEVKEKVVEFISDNPSYDPRDMMSLMNSIVVHAYKEADDHCPQGCCCDDCNSMWGV